MVWNAGSSGSVEIILDADGEKKSNTVDGNISLSDAVSRIATENNVKRFDIEDADGNVIDEDQGDRKVGELSGPLTMVPASAGY